MKSEIEMRKIKLLILLPFLVIQFGMIGCQKDDNSSESANPEKWELQNGDLVFQISQSGQSQAIQEATDCPYSHVGIIYLMDGKPYVFEAVKTVRLTPWKEWKDRGKGDHYIVMRSKQSLTEAMLLDIREYGEQFNGRDYDLQFRWSDDLMYCSELAWKLYKEGAGIELCAKNKVKNLKLDSKEVERIASKRYTNGFADVPMTEHIVTPADLLRANSIVEIYRTAGAPDY